MGLTRVSPGIYRDEKGNIVKQGGGGKPKSSKGSSNPLNLPKNVNQAYQNQVKFSTQAGDMLNNQMGQVFSQPWSPQGGFDRQRFEDQVFQSLTRNTDRDYSREREMTQQELADRGIPLDGSNENYKSTIGNLDERYDAIRANARGQATQMGSQEQQADFDRQYQTHQAQTGDVGTLSDLSGVGIGTHAGFQEQQTKKRLADASINQMAHRGGGGYTGGGASTTQSPFNTSTPPGYGG